MSKAFDRRRVVAITGLVLSVSLIASLLTVPTGAHANGIYHDLSVSSFSQNWSKIEQIKVDDDWNMVPSIVGFRGDDLTGATGTDPRTITGTSSVVDVNANRPAANGFVTGGVAEFHLADPVIGLQGSATADAPYIQLHLNSAGRKNVTVSYRLRDLEDSSDDAVQAVALQFRSSPAGAWTSVPAGYVPDATAGPDVAGPDTNVSAVLPASANNSAELQIRIITTNAGGIDEWVGVDDIVVSSEPCNGPCPVAPPPVLTSISEIQGESAISPKLNAIVSTEGIVTARARNGFYLQSTLPDSNPVTSEGIFVFTGTTPGAVAAIGHTIRVSGLVTEFSNLGDAAPTLTQLRDPFGMETIAAGSTANLPQPAPLQPADLSPTAAPDRLERYEGMLVAIPRTIVVAPTGARATFPDGQFFVTLPNLPPPMREPGLEANIQLATNLPPLPDRAPATVRRFDTNPEVLRVDTDELFAYDGQRTPGITAAVGASVAVFTAVLHFEDRRYNALPVVDTANDVRSLLSDNVLRPVQPVPGVRANQFTISSANLEFFSSSDTARLAKVVRTVCDVLRAPDILGVIEIDNLGSLTAIANAANSFGGGCTGSEYTAYLSSPDTPEQNTGFLVKSSRVTVIDAVRVNTVEGGLSPAAIFTQGDRKPYLLRATISQGGQSLPVTVILHHPKSLIDSDIPAGTSDRQKRLNHALYAANLVKRLQAENPDVLLALMGDLNAFEFSDGIVDVVGILRGDPVPDEETYVAGDSVDVYGTPGSDLVNLTAISEFSPTDRYTFNFRGNRQALDHILVNRNLYNHLRGYSIAHVNSLYPAFDPVSGQLLSEITSRPEGYSDHDAPIAYFSLGTAGVTDITGQVVVTSSGLSYNRATGMYAGTLKVQSSAAVSGPLHVVLANLPASITFVNESGVSPEGPYFSLEIPNLSAGQTVSVAIQLRNTSNMRPSWTPRVYSGNF